MKLESRKLEMNKYPLKESRIIMTDEERKAYVEKVHAIMARERIEDEAWWKTLTPEQQKAYNEDVEQMFDRKV